MVFELYNALRTQKSPFDSNLQLWESILTDLGIDSSEIIRYRANYFAIDVNDACCELTSYHLILDYLPTHKTLRPTLKKYSKHNNLLKRFLDNNSNLL